MFEAQRDVLGGVGDRTERCAQFGDFIGLVVEGVADQQEYAFGFLDDLDEGTAEKHFSNRGILNTPLRMVP